VHQDDLARSINAAEAIVITVYRSVELTVAAQRHELKDISRLRLRIDIGGQRGRHDEIGTRNIAFPRLNAFSYWIYLAGGMLLWISFAVDMGPDVGWFAYVPLAGPQYAPGKRSDIWAQMITFTELSALAVAVELAVTIFKQRAPGMSLDRIPLFVWAMLVTSFLIILAMPAIMVASTTLILDRLVGALISTIRQKAATCCSGSTSSGSSVTPRYTSSFCRQSAWCL
jgi:hypothetical protein